MESFLNELLAYTHRCNSAVIAAITNHRDQASQKAVALISHILNVQQIWNARLDGADSALPEPWAVYEVNQLGAFENQNYQHSIDALTKYALDDLVKWKTFKGDVYANSRRDILFQIINHATHHRAQIATEFRQSGIQPLLADFIMYKMTPVD